MTYRPRYSADPARVLLTVLVCVWQVLPLHSQLITAPGEVVSGRPFTLECKITRATGDRSALYWQRDVGQTISRIYASRVCNASIQVSPSSPVGLSGGCQHVNGEEVYTVTIENVTEDAGRGRWLCQHSGPSSMVTLDVKVMVTQVTLTILPDAVLAGGPSTFTCVTSASKPQACIRGYIHSSGNVRELDPPGGCSQDSSSVQITTRTLTFTASAEENGAELYCNASNSVTNPPVRSQVYTLNVHYPPQTAVLISGYVNNTAVESGETLTLTCQVGRGNPRPALSWSSGCVQTNTVPGNDGSQQISISITVSPPLNQKTCVCKGSQDGALTNWAEQESKTFNVLFGHDRVQLRAETGQSGNTVTVGENSTVIFTCTSGESNPATVLSWFNNSSPVATAELSDVSSQRGPNRGYLITQRYTLRVDRYQDGHVIRCEAQRPGHDQRVSHNLTVDVTYAPIVICNTTHVTVFEGQRVKISCDVISKLEVSVLWVKDGRQIDDASITNFRGPNRRDVTVATIEFGQSDKSLSGTFEIESRNSVGSFHSEVSVTVIEGQYIPNELDTKSCTNNEATLIWASGIDDSLVEYYNLEYKGTGEVWKEELVRNPGRVKLVRKTLTDLQSGVFYQFRLRPVSDISLAQYATANCTILNSQVSKDLSSMSEVGLSKAAMLGVGFVAGMALVALTIVMVTCWLFRKGRITWHSEVRGSEKQNTDHDVGLQRVAEAVEQPDPPPLGEYEDLDTSPSPVISESLAGLSGVVQHVYGEEVCTVTTENVPEDTRWDRWIDGAEYVTLNVKDPPQSGIPLSGYVNNTAVQGRET